MVWIVTRGLYIFYIFPIQALEGMTWTALGIASSAYIMPPEQRGWGMGVYQRTSSLGWILGPLIGGLVADSIGFKPMLLIGTGLAALGIPLVLLFLKEPRQAPE